MRITSDSLQISSSEAIAWEDVQIMRLLNDKLALVLANGRLVELDHMRPSTIDLVFRTYEKFLKEHPEKKRKRAL